MRKANVKPGRGDRLIKDANIGGDRHLVIDMSTSGRIHGEFLRLLYILAHRRTLKYFADMGDDEPGTDAFTWRRSQYF